MSIKRAAIHSLSVANNNKGGARATRKSRNASGREFISFCLQERYPLSDIGQVDAAWLTAWVAHLKSSGASTATIHNKVSCVRVLAKTRGQNLEKTGLDDSACLGLDKRCRKGTKEPISDEKYLEVLQNALAMDEVGFSHMVRLERYLGLRGLEALMSTHALTTFAKQAKVLMGRQPDEIQLFDGTKGGRPRRSAVIARYAQETFSAVLAALEFARKNDGFLLKGKPGTGLAGARRRYHRIASAVGLVGKFAPHSLRYRYCIDKLVELRDAGVPRSEALALASEWLGHSGSRGRFVSLVYGTAVTRSYPKTTRLQNIKKALAELNDISETIDPLPQNSACSAQNQIVHGR